MRQNSQQLLKILVLASIAILAVTAKGVERKESLTIRGQVIKQFDRTTQLNMKESLLDHQNSLITLDNGVQTAFLTEDDYFILRGVTPGKHIIEFTSKQYQYYKIVVIFNPKNDDEDNQVSIYSIDPNTYERVQEFHKPTAVLIKPVQTKMIRYFEEVESFNIMSLLSGQGIFIVIMIAMYLCFKNVDMEKLQQQAMDQQNQSPAEEREQIRGGSQ